MISAATHKWSMNVGKDQQNEHQHSAVNQQQPV